MNATSVGRYVLLAACLVAAAGREAAHAGDLVAVLPETTAAYVATTDATAAMAAWDRTLYARWFASAPMRPFVEQLKSEGADLSALCRRHVGLEPADVGTLQLREAVIAVASTSDKRPAALLIVDASGEAGDRLFALVDGRGREAGLTARAQDGPTGKLIVYSGAAADSPSYCVGRNDRVFVAGNDAETVGLVLQRASQPADPAAAAKPGLGKLPQAADLPGPKEPHLRFHLDPMALDALSFDGKPVAKKPSSRKKPPLVERLGFDGVKSIDGAFAFGVGDYDVFYRLAVYAPPPRLKGMKLFSFVNKAAKAPPAWLPAQFSSISTIGMDCGQLFEGFAAPFDVLAADDEEGTFDDIVVSYRDDPDGPGVDLRKELFGRLGNQITLFGDYVLPFGPKSERNLVAIDTSAAKELRSVLARLVQDDPDVLKRTVAGQPIWEVQPTPSKSDSQERLPKLAVTVAHDHLLIATHVELLEKVLTSEGGSGIAADPTYTAVVEQLNRLGPADACLRICARAENDYRLTYELARSGKLAQSESAYGLVMRAIVGEGKNRVESTAPSLLPDFEMIRSYLAPVGMIGAAHDEGWTLVGFTLRPQAAASPAPSSPGK